MSLFFLLPNGGNRTGTVTLSGENVSVSQPGIGHRAGVRFNNDGTVDKNEDTLYTQVDTATDWIIPNSASSTVYEIKVDEVSKTGTDLSPTTFGTMSTWIPFITDPEWWIAVSTVSKNATWNLNVTIRRNGTTVAGPVAYQLTSVSTGT